MKYQAVRNGQHIGKPGTKEEAEAIIRRDKEHSQVCVDLGWLDQRQHDASRWYIMKVRG